MFLDDDMIAAHDLLEAHLRRHTTDPDAVVLGAMFVHEESPRSFMTEGLARWAEKRNARLSDHAAGIPVTEMLGGHLSLSRKAFDALGQFDAAFTAGGRFVAGVSARVSARMS